MRIKLNVTTSINRKEGFPQLGYSDEEKQAHVQFINIANELGLYTYQLNNYLFDLGSLK